MISPKALFTWWKLRVETEIGGEYLSRLLRELRILCGFELGAFEAVRRHLNAKTVNCFNTAFKGLCPSVETRRILNFLDLLLVQHARDKQRWRRCFCGSFKIQKL